MTNEMLEILAELERDTAPEVASAFGRLVTDYFAETRQGSGRVSTGLLAEDLARRFAEPLPRSGQTMADVLARLASDVLADSNRLCHPRSMGHQVSAPLPAAVWTDLVTSALNQSGAVWEMSPVGTVIETQVLRWMCTLAGFGPESGGAFAAGGTEATFAGLLAARHASLPDVWRRGVGADAPIVLCGEHSHYSVARAVGELGVGTDHLDLVPSRGFHMDVGELTARLDRARRDGRRVMAVVATAGTTATGSFDDIDQIGRVCEERDIWLHVDGAHGASALLSPRERHRLAGVDRARSLAWDPHKMMLMPLTASMVLVRRESDLEAAFSQKAPYLFHAGAGTRNWDQGLRAVQCSRRVDALKVWVALQRYGADALGAIYEHLCDNARTLHALVAADPRFEALHAPESNILCFRYRGGRAMDDEALDALNLRLREAYNREGAGWITTTVLGGRRVLRATLMNPRTKAADLEALLVDLAADGSRLGGSLRRQ